MGDVRCDAHRVREAPEARATQKWKPPSGKNGMTVESDADVTLRNNREGLLDC